VSAHEVSILECPNCGAVLSAGSSNGAAGDLWPCLYCGALVRVSHTPTGPAQATVEGTVVQDVMARVRERVLAGAREEAIALCESSGVSRESAVEAVDALARSVSGRAIMSQALSPVGWLIAAAALAACGGGAWLAAAADGIAFWTGVVLATFASFNLLAISRGIGTSLRFLSAPRASALVRSVAEVGTRQAGGAPIRIFSLAVDVQPESGGSFHGQLVVPSREASVHKVQVGARFPVRYRPGDPSWLRYDALSDRS